MNTRSQDGFAIAVYLAVVAVAAGMAWLVKPSMFPGASRRATKSTETTVALVKATNAQGAAAAASVVKIGEANAAAPASPSRDFIGSEVPVALSRLPAPDPVALLEAERRRSAVMEGRVEEARRLYETAAKKSERLQTERDTAIADRRAADLALEQSAAAEHARTAQVMIVGAIAFIAFVGWAYAKLNGVSLKSIGSMAADIRAGEDPIKALSFYTAPWHHATIQKHAKLATPLSDTSTQTK